MEIIHLSPEQIRLIQDRVPNNFENEILGSKTDSSVRDSLHNLLTLIAQHGILEPLHVAKYYGSYMLLDGYGVFTAAKELGISKIPCILLPPTRVGIYNLFLYKKSAANVDNMGFEIRNISREQISFEREQNNTNNTNKEDL